MAVRISRVVLSVIIACFWLHNASIAASINHGDFDDIGGGGTVFYEDVTESSVTDPVPLYGSPIVAGNLLNFSPINFVATSSFGSPADDTTGVLTMDVRSTALNHIADIGFSEAGDYTLTLAFGSTANTEITIEANYTINVLEIDGAAPSIPVSISGSMTFTPVAPYTLPGDAGSGVAFVGSAFEDIQTAILLSGNTVIDGATLISVELDNMLQATSDAGTIASISKKNLGLSLIVNNGGPPATLVPEPSTVVMTLLGLAGLLVCTRRKKMIPSC